MIRRLMLLTLVATFLLACTTSTTAVTAPPTSKPYGVGVTIDSRPDNAEVRVDGKFIGTTPLNHRMAPGEHKIEVSRDDFETWTRELTVIADNPSRVVALLRKTIK